MKTILIAGAMALMGVAAQADEVWTTLDGGVIYEADIDGQAILSFPAGDGQRARMYFPGLGGNYDNRSLHQGYWILPGGDECDSEMTGPDGWSSREWGRVTIAFDRSAFPTPWTAMFGGCFGELEYPMRGELD